MLKKYIVLIISLSKTITIGSRIPIKKHLLFILIGAIMGIIPGLIIFFSLFYNLGFEGLQFILLTGGIFGSIGGWFGGYIFRKIWGAAVMGGLFGFVCGSQFYWMMAS